MILHVVFSFFLEWISISGFLIHCKHEDEDSWWNCTLMCFRCIVMANLNPAVSNYIKPKDMIVWDAAYHLVTIYFSIIWFVITEMLNIYRLITLIFNVCYVFILIFCPNAFHYKGNFLYGMVVKRQVKILTSQLARYHITRSCFILSYNGAPRHVTERLLPYLI